MLVRLSENYKFRTAISNTRSRFINRSGNTFTDGTGSANNSSNLSAVQRHRVLESCTKSRSQSSKNSVILLPVRYGKPPEIQSNDRALSSNYAFSERLNGPYSDNALADHYGIDRQIISNFKQREGVQNIQRLIIDDLLIQLAAAKRKQG